MDRAPQHGQHDRAVRRAGRARAPGMQEVVDAPLAAHPPRRRRCGYRQRDGGPVPHRPEQVAHKGGHQSGRYGWPGHNAWQAQRPPVELAAACGIRYQNFANQLVRTIGRNRDCRAALVHRAGQRMAVDGDTAREDEPGAVRRAPTDIDELLRAVEVHPAAKLVVLFRCAPPRHAGEVVDHVHGHGCRRLEQSGISEIPFEDSHPRIANRPHRYV